MPTREDEITHVAEQFYAAVNTLLQGDAEPLIALWSDRDDVTYFDTQGKVHRGFAAVRAYFEQGGTYNRASPSRALTTPEVLLTSVSGRTAYFLAIERTQVTLDGFVHSLEGRATNIFRMEQNQWKMVHRHTEPPRETEPPKTLLDLDQRGGRQKPTPTNPLAD